MEGYLISIVAGVGVSALAYLNKKKDTILYRLKRFSLLRKLSKAVKNSDIKLLVINTQ